VPSDHLGLFDTPPDRKQVRLGLIIVGLQFVAFLAILPVANVRVGVFNPFIPLVDALMLISEMIIATMLYAQASVYRSRALAMLASGYVFSSLLLIFHALTFPGLFAPNGLLAGVSTTAWLAIFRRFGFPIAVILYGILKAADAVDPNEAERRSPSTVKWLLGAAALASAVTALATVGEGILPSLFLNLRETDFLNLTLMHCATIILTIVAMWLVFRREKSVLEVWLLVALAGWLIQSTLNVSVHARYTIGFYSVLIIMLAASLIVMTALVAESNRLYSRLAIATSVRNRELDARMMSMDAVAAAISQEVGQPLTGANLSASASLQWLTGDKPNVHMAIQSLQESIDSGRRTFDVIKSIRSTIAEQLGPLREVSVNDLVREAATAMDRELAAQKISVRLKLDETLGSTLLNEVQMRRVLVHLLTDAMESVTSANGKARQISIRTAPLNDDSLVVEVSNSGKCASSKTIAHLFDPGSNDRGLALSVSRTIVEKHGGQLWASTSDGEGATFHIRLPQRASSVGKNEEPELVGRVGAEITRLVERIEREIAEVGSVSASSADRLHALRLKAETLLAGSLPTEA
jgi:signal transduction histidine kinase